MKTKNLTLTLKVREDAPDFVLPKLTDTVKETLTEWLAAIGQGFEGMIEMEITDGPD